MLAVIHRLSHGQEIPGIPQYFPIKHSSNLREFEKKMSKRKKTKEELEFIRRNPSKYRIAVMGAFLSYMLENEWAKPQAVIDDMFANSDLEDYEHLDNVSYLLSKLKEGRNTGASDPVFFELVSDFMWRHDADKIIGLSVTHEILGLGNLMNSMYQFHKEEHYKGSSKFFSMDKNQMLRSLQGDVVYKFDAVKNRLYGFLSGEIDRRIKDQAKKGKNSNLKVFDNDCEKYFVKIELDEMPYNLILSFDESESMTLHYGIELPAHHSVFLKNAETMEPVFFKYSGNPQKTDGKRSSLLINMALTNHGKRVNHDGFKSRYFNARPYDVILRPVEDKVKIGYVRSMAKSIVSGFFEKSIDIRM